MGTPALPDAALVLEVAKLLARWDREQERAIVGAASIVAFIRHWDLTHKPVIDTVGREK
jgi:hypothetical protein